MRWEEERQVAKEDIRERNDSDGDFGDHEVFLKEMNFQPSSRRAGGTSAVLTGSEGHFSAREPGGEQS